MLAWTLLTELYAVEPLNRSCVTAGPDSGPVFLEFVFSVPATEQDLKLLMYHTALAFLHSQGSHAFKYIHSACSSYIAFQRCSCSEHRVSCNLL